MTFLSPDEPTVLNEEEGARGTAQASPQEGDIVLEEVSSMTNLFRLQETQNRYLAEQIDATYRRVTELRVARAAASHDPHLGNVLRATCAEFERVVAKAVLHGIDANSQTIHLSSFCELEMYFLTPQRCGSVAACRWKQFQRLLPLTDAYYDFFKDVAAPASSNTAPAARRGIPAHSSALSTKEKLMAKIQSCLDLARAKDRGRHVVTFDEIMSRVRDEHPLNHSSDVVFI